MPDVSTFESRNSLASSSVSWGKSARLTTKSARPIENSLAGCTGLECLHHMTVSVGDFTTCLSDYGTLIGNISLLLEREAVR